MLFETQIQQQAGQLALSDLTRERTWQALHNNVLALSGALQNQYGLEPNQHIALLMGNRVEFIEVMLAGIVSGLWITPINTHLVAEEVGYILKDSGATVVFYDSQHEHLLPEQGDCQCLNIETLMSKLADENGSIKASLEPAQPAGGTMLYTSGTTGKPKGVKRNKPNSLGEALDKMAATGRMFGLDGRGPHLVTGPLYHAAPMLFAIYDMLNGAPMIILPKWDNERFLQTVEAYQVTTSHLVPTMFVRLLDYREREKPRYDLSSLTTVLHGAAPIAVSTKEKMIEWWGEILIEYWGGTEAGVTTLVDCEAWQRKPGTVGKPLPHFQVYVGDEEGNPTGEDVGPLYCRHAQLAQVFEYHNDPKKTAKAHPQPHVFCIGDIGSVDDDGYVYLSDRQSNMIISGGVNIYPAEIEQAFIDHPAIADVAVFGIPNPEWGEEVKAVIQLKDADQATDAMAQQLLDYAKGKVARYKVPRSIAFEAELPRTPTGKLLTRKLKRQYGETT